MADPIIAPLVVVGSIVIVFGGYLFNEFMCSTRMRNAIRENPADFLCKDY